MDKEVGANDTGGATTTAAPGAGGQGVFNSIKTPEPSPADAKQTQTPEGTGKATEDGQSPATPAKTDDGTAAKTTEATPKHSIGGREFTTDELVKAYERSSKEGLRLHKEAKEGRGKMSALEAEVSDLRTMTDVTPPFKVLSREELEALDSVEMSKYHAEEAQWRASQQTRKDSVDKAQKQRTAEDEESSKFIMARSGHMESDTENFPGYTDLIPVMDEFLDVAPFMTGHRATPDILYFAALGLKTSREQTSAKHLATKSAEDAKAKAAAAAQSIGTGGKPTTTTSPSSKDDDSDEAFNQRLVSKAPGRIFG